MCSDKKKRDKNGLFNFRPNKEGIQRCPKVQEVSSFNENGDKDYHQSDNLLESINALSSATTTKKEENEFFPLLPPCKEDRVNRTQLSSSWRIEKRKKKQTLFQPEDLTGKRN